MQATQSDIQQSAVIEAVLKALAEVRFGAIEITVHEGRVTQIERREKVRFGQQSTHQYIPTATAAVKQK